MSFGIREEPGGVGVPAEHFLPAGVVAGDEVGLARDSLKAGVLQPDSGPSAFCRLECDLELGGRALRPPELRPREG